MLALLVMSSALMVAGCGSADTDANYTTEQKLTPEEKAKAAESLARHAGQTAEMPNKKK